VGEHEVVVCLFKFLLGSVFNLQIRFITQYIIHHRLPSASVTCKRSRGVNTV
jgi:hypothetical protein